MSPARRRDLARPDSMVDGAGRPDRALRQGMLIANVWLLFLLFPALTLVAGDLSPSRKAVALVLVVVFALIHLFAYRDLIRRELGLDAGLGPDRSRWWFAALVAINGAAFLVGSWPMLAMLPFVVSYAMFHFSWRPGVVVAVLALTSVLVLPALGGVLGDTWFFSILVLSVAAAAAIMRLNDEGHRERALLLRQLAVSQERDRVARDVHDVLGHSLTVVVLKTQVCDRLLASLQGDDSARRTTADVDPVLEHARAQLAEIESVGRKALTEIRATVGGLRSADFADELAAARVVLADAGVDLVVNGEANSVTPHERSLIGWVVREAVTNVIRHARANRVQVDLAPGLESKGKRVLLRISDDGVGLGDSRPGNGLTGLEERVGAHGATLRLTSGNGTTIEIVAPRQEIGV